MVLLQQIKRRRNRRGGNSSSIEKTTTRTNASNEVPVSTEFHQVQLAVEQIQISPMMLTTNEMESEEFAQWTQIET